MIFFDNFSFSYGDTGKNQLNNFSLKINEGEFVLLCGASACGKTTVTKCINGLIPHCTVGNCKGSVWVKGKDVSQTATYTLAQYVGSVFQNPKTQFFNLDARSELVFGMENLGMSPDQMKKRIEQVISDFDIQDILKRNVFDLSEGEKQILALSSVYAVNPDIYVLDEPTANMDESAVRKLHEILLKLKNMGKTIVISEHRLYFLMDLVDKAVYIKNGCLEKIYSGKEFRTMDENMRKMLGLRCFSLPIASKKEEEKEMEGYMCVENLSVSIHKKRLLQEVSFSAKIGDIIAVTGLNGVGKSQLLRVLCGLGKENTGKVYIEGKPVSYKKRRSLCTMTMQDVVHQLFSDSVEEEISLLNDKIEEEKVTSILEELDLLDFKDRHPMTLSGGQKQRLVLAGAFLSAREIMLFDEPTSGLDYANMCRVCKLIQKISKKGIVFVATHDKELIHMLCNKELHIQDKKSLLYHVYS